MGYQHAARHDVSGGFGKLPHHCRNGRPRYESALDDRSGNGVAAGSTLVDLQLRAKTGAQAVALRRDDEMEFAIEADMPLCAGDILGLAGSEAQIEAALALLGRGRG